MIKTVVREIREIYSDLSQEFHSVFVPITAEAGLGTYVVVDFIFEFLDRCKMFILYCIVLYCRAEQAGFRFYQPLWRRLKGIAKPCQVGRAA